MASVSAVSHPLPRRLAAESVGTALLLLAVVGSGIMAQRTCSNDGLALLANALATAGALFALITVFAPISGAHFNPAVSLLAAWRGELLRVEAVAYCIVQCAGALCGAMLAHALFEMPLLQSGGAARTGFHLLLSEGVATFGLLLVIVGCSARASERTPLAVALWIMGAYWFTSSTSFANPAVTLARACSNTFAGIQPADAPAFICAQLLATLVAALLLPALLGLARRQR